MRDTNIKIVSTNSLKNQPDSRLKYPQWAPTHQLYYHQLEGRYNSLTFLLPTTLIIICCYNNCNYNDLWSTSFAIFNINNMWSSALCDMFFLCFFIPMVCDMWSLIVFFDCMSPSHILVLGTFQICALSIVLLHLFFPIRLSILYSSSGLVSHWYPKNSNISKSKYHIFFIFKPTSTFTSLDYLYYFFLKICLHKLGFLRIVTPLLNYSLFKLFTLFRRGLYILCTLVQ